MKHLAGMAMALTIALTPYAANALDRTQPIRVLTAFPAGGVTDIAARIVADAMGKELGQTVVVENKPGGDGTIALVEVAQSAPDGHTLFVGGFGGQLIPPLVKKNFPVDIDTQLTLIARPTGFANVLVVNNDFPTQTVQELIDYAKAHPGEINFGTAASTSSDRLTTELFMQATGTELTRVPYKGGTPALNDLSAGVIQMMFGNVPAAMGLIDGGLLRALAVTSSERVPNLPNVPTMQEAGLPEFNVTSWNSFFGPAGMSEEDVKLLSDTIVKVTQQTDVIAALEKVGFTVIGEGAAEFEVSFEEERQRWKAVIDAAGITE